MLVWFLTGELELTVPDCPVLRVVDPLPQGSSPASFQQGVQTDPSGFIIHSANRVQMLPAQLLLDESLSRTEPLPIVSLTSLSSSALIYLLQNHCFSGLHRV